MSIYLYSVTGHTWAIAQAITSCYSTTQSKIHIRHSSTHTATRVLPSLPLISSQRRNTSASPSDKPSLTFCQRFSNSEGTPQPFPAPTGPRSRLSAEAGHSGLPGLPDPPRARRRYSPRKSSRLRARRQPASIALASPGTGEEGTGEGDGSRLRRERRRCRSGVGAGRTAPDLYEPAGEAGRRWPVLKPRLGSEQVPGDGLVASCPATPGRAEPSRAQQHHSRGGGEGRRRRGRRPPGAPHLEWCPDSGQEAAPQPGCPRASAGTGSLARL